MPVVSIGGTLGALAGYDQTKQQAMNDTLNQMYDADYRRYRRDKTAYEADVAGLQDQALHKAPSVFGNTPEGRIAATLLQAAQGKNGANVWGQYNNQNWKLQAAQANDPNRAAFLANLGGVHVDPRYNVKDGVRFGRYDGSIATTPVGQSSIAANNALAQLRQAQVPLAQARTEAARAKAEGQTQKPVTLSSALIKYVQETAPALADAYYQQSFHDDAPDQAKAWIQNRALGYVQQGMSVDQAMQRAINDAANMTTVDKGWFFDSLRFNPTAAPTQSRPNPDDVPPVPGARKAPNGKWYVQKGGKWYLVQQ